MLYRARKRLWLEAKPLHAGSHIRRPRLASRPRCKRRRSRSRICTAAAACAGRAGTAAPSPAVRTARANLSARRVTAEYDAARHRRTGSFRSSNAGYRAAELAGAMVSDATARMPISCAASASPALPP